MLTVDRPQARNALTGAMYFGIRYAIDRVNADPDLAGLLITGIDDVFIPGGDLGASTIDDWGGPKLLGMDNVPFDAVRHSPKPIVSAINGICQGGGLLIAIMSDVAVASDRAVFRAPEIYRGIADTGYASYLPAQIGPARAKDMLFTGRRVTAPEALEWGLVTRVVAHEELMTAATRVLEDCMRGAPGRPAGGQARDRSALRPVRPDDDGGEPWQRGGPRGLGSLPRQALPQTGCPLTCGRDGCDSLSGGFSIRQFSRRHSPDDPSRSGPAPRACGTTPKPWSTAICG